MNISKKRRDIDTARRDEMKRVMGEYDENVYYPAIRALRYECGATEKGHNWRFSDLNPVGLPIYACTRCGATHIGELDNAVG